MSLLKEVKRYLTNWPPDTPSGPVILGDPPRAIPVSESRETYPAVNLWEDDDFVYAQAMLPGEKLPDLEITVAVNEDKSYLAIKGVRKNLKPEKAVWHNRERRLVASRGPSTWTFPWRPTRPMPSWTTVCSSSRWPSANRPNRRKSRSSQSKTIPPCSNYQGVTQCHKPTSWRMALS